MSRGALTTCFQMSPSDLSDEMLRWLLEHDVYVPALDFIVLFRMPAETAEQFVAGFPSAIQFILTE